MPGGNPQESGGAGALWFGLKRPEFVNAIQACRPIIATSTLPEETMMRYRRHQSPNYRERQRAWGRREWGLKTAEGEPAWAVQDCAALVKNLRPTKRAPFVGIAGGGEDIQAFIKLLR